MRTEQRAMHDQLSLQLATAEAKLLTLLAQPAESEERRVERRELRRRRLALSVALAMVERDDVRDYAGEAAAAQLLDSASQRIAMVESLREKDDSKPPLSQALGAPTTIEVPREQGRAWSKGEFEAHRYGAAEDVKKEKVPRPEKPALVGAIPGDRRGARWSQLPPGGSDGGNADSGGVKGASVPFRSGPEGITAAVASQRDRLRACLAAHQLAAAVQLQVGVRIDSSGAFRQPSVVGDVPPQTRACLEDVFRSMRVEGYAGGSRRATVPLWFNSQP